MAGTTFDKEKAMASASVTHDHEQREGRRIPLVWLVGLLAAAAVVSMATLGTTRAAFSSATGNGTSKFKAGTVNLTANDTASVPFDLQAMVPGVAVSKCINVTYVGVSATVRLYGAVTSSLPANSLAPYLNTKIEEGTTSASPGTTFDCSTFSQAAPAPAPVFDSTLQAFASKTDFATGIPVFNNGAPTGNTSRAFKITVSVQDTNAAQGKDADATFTWEAQNV